MADTDIIAQAEALIGSGKTVEAVNLIERASAENQPDALFQKAIWQLIGDPIPRDLTAALCSLRNARKSGHADAILIETALIANGTGTAVDFAAARNILEAVAIRHAGAGRLLNLLSRMQLSPDGTPAKPPVSEALDATGLVRRVSRFLSAEECAHIAQAANDLLEPALVVDPRTGRHVPHPIRTSDGAVIGPTREDLVIRAINLRLAALTATDVRQGEALAILRYRPGQQFRLHSDAITDAANQRIATVLVYLNEGFSGGETSFPELGLTVIPRAGDAIVFENVLADGSTDPRLRHAGLPVTQGTKWLATRWIRAHPIDPWNMANA